MSVEGGFLQAASYGAEVLRRATLGVLLERGSSIGSVKGGLVGATDLETKAGSGLNIETSPGEIIVDQAYSASGGPNYIRLTSTLTTKVPAANATNPRIDCLCAQVLDAAYHGSSNEYALTYLEGTPTAGATLANRATHGQPSLPTSAEAVDYILVPANATKVENANIEKVATPLTISPQVLAELDEAIYTAALKNEAVTGPKLGTETLRMLASSKYAEYVTRSFSTAYTPSASRPVWVNLLMTTNTTNAGGTLYVGEVKVAPVTMNSLESRTNSLAISVLCMPNETWEMTNLEGMVSLYSSYRTL